MFKIEFSMKNSLRLKLAKNGDTIKKTNKTVMKTKTIKYTQ
jgi:hypothetical protein